MTTIEASVLLAAVERGQAHPIGDLVHDYIHYDGSWWTPLVPAAPGTGHTPPVPDEAAGRDRDDQSETANQWQRIPVGDFSGQLDASAQRLRAGDKAVQEQRSRPSRAHPAKQR